MTGASRIEDMARRSGWGSVFSARLAFVLSCVVLLSAAADANSPIRRAGLVAGMILAALAGFLVIRLIVERSNIAKSGLRIAVWTLVSIVLVLALMVSRDPATFDLLAIVMVIGAGMTASRAWLWGISPRWLRLTPMEGSASRVARFSELNEVIQRNPGDANAYVERSKILLERRQPERALSDLAQARLLDPKNEHYHLYLSHLVYLRNNQFPQALTDIQAAIEASADARDEYYVAAVLVLVLMDRIDAAEALLAAGKGGHPAGRSLHDRAFSGALAYLDRAINSEIAMQSEPFWDGDCSRLNSLRLTRANVAAHLPSRFR